MIKKAIYVLICFSLFFSNMYISKAADETLGDLKAQLEQYKKDYEQNKLEIEMTKEEREQLNVRIEEINKRIFEIGIEVQNLNEEIRVLNEKIKANEAEIKDILVFFQLQGGEIEYLEYLFNSKDFTDFIYRISTAEQLTLYNDNLIDTQLANIEANKLKTNELEDKKIELNEEQELLGVELTKIEADLKSYDEESLSIEELIEAKEQEIKAFTDLGCTDDQTLIACLTSKDGADVSFWRPVAEGFVTSDYGYRYSSSSEVSSFHNGIDIGAYGGYNGNIPIYPSANGIVVYTTNYSGYTCSPRRIHIQHIVNGKIYTTGYLHMHEIYVSVGDIVSKTDVIGTMGGYEVEDTCSTGAHLHFEVSTGTFNNGDYYSKRYDPRNILDFPSKSVDYWTRY